MKDQNRITEEFRVKGMICSRCLKVLNDELRQAGAEILEIELGRVVINYSSQKISRSHIERVIRENEFSLIWDKETLLAEQTKRWVINYIWFSFWVSWWIKWIILKHGHFKAYRNATPFFFGLIVGEYTMGCFWNLLGITFGFQTYGFFES